HHIIITTYTIRVRVLGLLRWIFCFQRGGESKRYASITQDSRAKLKIKRTSTKPKNQTRMVYILKLGKEAVGEF
ncbi:MAG: hypothetical protein ACH346_04860, partial [Chthoniobacterales bacterium]